LNGRVPTIIKEGIIEPFITEYVGLRAKMYTYIMVQKPKKWKGI